MNYKQIQEQHSKIMNRLEALEELEGCITSMKEHLFFKHLPHPSHPNLHHHTIYTGDIIMEITNKSKDVEGLILKSEEAVIELTEMLEYTVPVLKRAKKELAKLKTHST